MALGDSITTNLVEKVIIGDSQSQIASTAYGDCVTPAATSAKLVAMDGFVAVEGVTVHIRFQYNNTADSPTLNVNGTGGFSIIQYGSTNAGSGTLINGWPAGAVISFTLVKTNNTWQWVRDFGVNTDTTYDVQHTYSGTSEDPISGKGVKAAIETLDKSNITGFGAGKTLETLTETDGIINATFQNIQITESQVTDLTTDLNAKAPKNNPVFTGVVTLPAINVNSDDSAAATKKYVDDRSAGLTGALHYIGDATVTIDDTTGAITVSGLPQDYVPEAGDIILGDHHKEYIYTGANWRELGDEGSYALKTKTDTAIKNASVSYTRPTLTNNEISYIASATQGSLPTLNTQSVTITGVANAGQVTTAEVNNGSLVITLGTNTTTAAAETFNAVRDNGFSQGTLPTFTPGNKTIGITGGGASLTVPNDGRITVVVP